MRVLAIVLGVTVAVAIVVATFVLAAVRREHTDPVGAHTSDGDRPRGGGVAPAYWSAAQPCDPRPSVPAHEQIPGYRPDPGNRDWCNDFALAGALDAWSREVSP